jgi:hypothetical protein
VKNGDVTMKIGCSPSRIGILPLICGIEPLQIGNSPQMGLHMKVESMNLPFFVSNVAYGSIFKT